jgi:HAD superfamily hydrolase (TIGR01509 family)
MKAIAFDFDGTLVDTEPIHEEALRVAAREYGADVLEGETIGLADEDALIRSLERAGIAHDESLIGEACRVKTEAYLDMIDGADITVYEGAVELVRTAAVRAEVLPVLARLGIEELVGVVVCADEVEAKKPDPAGYLETVRRLGVEAAACVVIEDSVRGVAAAKGAGCPVVAVGHTTERTRLGGADVYVARVADVDLALLERVVSDAARVRAGG